MASFAQFGNDLYTGKRSIDFIGKRKIWYGLAALLVLVCVAVPFLTGGYNVGIEFRGGSEFRVSGVSVSSDDQATAVDTVRDVVADAEVNVAVLGSDSLRLQTEQLTDGETREVVIGLQDAFDVPASAVASSYVGPSWGQDISAQALRALVVFLILVGVVMALYFRTWKMSLAAMVALLHDLVVTIGFYGLTGFEVTPAAVIGMLTILGYSLYDTVVVFDKIRENTSELHDATVQQFRDQVNLAVNQTLVRSINTSVVAVLPVGAILFIGAFLLGAGTLQDIALALFVGMLVGTYSTIFLAAPLYSQLREGEKRWNREPVAA